MSKIYLAIFLTATILAIIECFKTKTTISVFVMVLTVIGSALTIQDLWETSQKLTHIDELTTVNNSIVLSTKKLTEVNNTLETNTGKAVAVNLDLTQKISIIEKDIQAVTRSTAEVSKITQAVSQDIKDFTTSANTYPKVTIIPSVRENYFSISLQRRGKFPITGLVITITDLEKMFERSRYPQVPSELKAYTSTYKINNLSQDELLDTIPMKSWKEYPEQRFDIEISTSTGHYIERIYTRLKSDSTFDEAWRIVKWKNNNVVYDSLEPPSVLGGSAFNELFKYRRK
jgi:hypothetical protein